ncbi:MFS transporter [Anaerorhabdus sp.]|uniref:MFS transporter n=1 Tax=Anaerorhabdus sp. TaxID=1872524 RepID=UPI002FCA4025
MKNKKFHYAWIILIAMSLIRGVSGPGINASSGVFMTPVSETLGVGIGQLSLYLSISSIATLIWLPIAGNLINKKKVKTVVVLGVLLQTIAFIVLGFMSNIWAWYILAVPLAMGAALLVNLLGPVLVNRWFNKNIGVVMGLMMMITSLLGAVFQPVLTNLIANNGWRFTYIAFGIFGLVFMLLVGLIFLKNAPNDMGLKPFGWDEQNKVESTNQKAEGIQANKALKSPAFFTLLLFMIVLTGFAAFQQHIATFGLGMGLDMVTIGKALSISMIGSAIGSVLIGLLSDRLGIVLTSVGVMGVGVFAIALFYISDGNTMMFIIATFLHGLAISSIGVVAPLLTIKFFGSLDYEKLFSTVMIGSPLASIVLMPLYGYIYDTFGNYNYVFIFLLVALIVASAGLIFGYNNSKKLLQSNKMNNI